MPVRESAWKWLQSSNVQRAWMNLNQVPNRQLPLIQAGELWGKLCKLISRSRKTKSSLWTINLYLILCNLYSLDSRNEESKWRSSDRAERRKGIPPSPVDILLRLLINYVISFFISSTFAPNNESITFLLFGLYSSHYNIITIQVNKRRRNRRKRH